MKGLVAFLLITAGSVGASIGVARTDPSVEGWVSTFQVQVPWTAVSLIVLAVGIGIKMASDRAHRAAEAAGGGSLRALQEAAARMVTDLEALVGDLDGLDARRLHDRVDALVTGPVADFVDNRDALQHAFGMAHYAAVMSEFAPGERYLNRAWSASTDGYLAEAAEYVRRALPALRAARERMAGTRR